MHPAVRPDVIDSPGFRSIGGGFVPLPKVKPAVRPVVGRIVSSARELHGKIVDGRNVIDRYLPEKLKHPEKFLP